MKSIKRYSNMLCFTCLTLFSVNAFSAEPVPIRENKFTIGAGISHNSVPYTASEARTDLVPLFDIQFGPLFAYNYTDEPVIGVELFRHKRVMLALAAIYGSQQLKISDISNDKAWVYFGIEDRDRATEVALMFDFYSKVGLVEIMVARDVSNTYDDFRSSISWSRPFPDTGKWTVTPRMYGKYYSIKYNNYYFGVSEDEQRAARDLYPSGLPVDGLNISFEDYRDDFRPDYKSGNTGHFGVDLTVDYNFTEHFKVQGYVGIEQLAGRVTSSILTEDNDIIRTSLGLLYTF